MTAREVEKTGTGTCAAGLLLKVLALVLGSWHGVLLA